MKTCNITYLSPYFWPETIGSAPYCSELAFYLAKQNHKVSVISFRPHYPTPKGFEAWQDGKRDSEVHEGVGIDRIPAGARMGGGFKERFRNDLRYMAAVIKGALIGNYNNTESIVAYVPSVFTVIGAVLLKWRTGAKLTVVVHDIESGLAESLGLVKKPIILKILRLVERVALNRADTIVVLTEGMNDELIRIGCSRPIVVLPIWAEVFDEVKKDGSEKPVVMYSGNFGKKQNLDQLLPVIDLLDKRFPDVRVILRGDGSEKKRIMNELLQSYKVKNTQFDGLVPAEQLVSSLQSADVHLVPQALNVANYALPSKLISIMSAGRPFICIAEKDSPLDKLAATSKAGVNVYPGNVEDLFASITKVLSDPELKRQMGENGRNYVKTSMNAETVLAAYQDLITGQTKGARQ